MKSADWEAILAIVEILALMITFYFSKQVSKLAKEANDIINPKFMQDKSKKEISNWNFAN